MTTNQESEAPNNEVKQEIRENVFGSKNENDDEVSVVGSLYHENTKNENLGGMDMLVLACSEDCDRIDEEKVNEIFGFNQERNDGDWANVDEGRNCEFLVGDLVWGKIKNYPSWPGLIYDPSDASDSANKSKQVNKLLVAYFGDGTYSWCSWSQLVPFVDHYEKMSTQSSSRNFVYAVEEALEELGRRIEQTMICSCLPEENLSGLVRPEAVNAGVRSGVLLPDGVIGKLPSLWCEPAELLEYVRNVQTFPVSNLLQRVVMKRFLSAFSCVKRGYRLPIYREPQLIEGLEEKSENVVPDTNDFSVPIRVPIDISSEEESSGSQKFPVKGLMLTSTQKRKQKSVAEIIGEAAIDKLEGKKKCKIIAEKPSARAICKKTASNADSNRSDILLAYTATGISRRKKIDNLVNDGIPNIVENERSGSIKRKHDEGTDGNASGTQPSSAARRKICRKEADNSVASSIVSNEDVQVESVKSESIPFSELKKNADPDDVDVETSNKMEVYITPPDSSDTSGAIESAKMTSKSPRTISLKNPVSLQPKGGDVSHVDFLLRNVAHLKSTLHQCDGNISAEEKSSLEGEVRSMLEKIGELAVKETS